MLFGGVGAAAGIHATMQGAEAFMPPGCSWVASIGAVFWWVPAPCCLLLQSSLPSSLLLESQTGSIGVSSALGWVCAHFSLS